MDTVRYVAERLVLDCEANKDLKASLLNDPRRSEGRVMRQIDVKVEDGQVVLKAFASYGKHGWHIMLEGLEEDVWETGQSNL